MADCEILVIGAGHNALVCAGYLAQAGYRVTVLERRGRIGGAVVTEEIVPGFKFDLGGSAHILIHHTPIVRDLQLAQYGLEYIDCDPLFYAPFPDGTQFTTYKSIDQTCESIATFSPADAENYRAFIERWRPMAEGVVGAFTNEPSPLNLVRYLASRGGSVPTGMADLPSVVGSYGRLIREQFVSPQVQALIAWMAAQSGPPPEEGLSAPFALWHPMYHVSGMKRPRGGSGMLTQALGKMIEAHGGTVCTDSPVSRILVENGHAVGAELVNGERVTASRAVVSGAHVHTTGRMLGDDAPPGMRRAIDRSRIGNGFGMIVRMAVHELPNYTHAPTPVGSDRAPHHNAMQFICPSIDYLNKAYADYAAGRPSDDPALISMTWSAIDDTLAPAGKHVCFLWGQYFPYELASGESWDVIGDRVADRMLATLAKYAPNMTPDNVIGRLVETPLYLERELGLLRGNVMHLEMSVNQMFMLRPSLSMSRYRTPIDDLYITGASTHPGGGIMGASGRNAAAAVLLDLTKRKR